MENRTQDKFEVLSSRKKKRFSKWWKGELRDPLIWITCDFPRWSGPYEDGDFKKTWCDPEFRIESFLKEMESAIFIGDSISYHFINYGPCILASFIGGKINFDAETMWIESTLEEYENLEEKLSLDKDNYYWNLVEELTDLSLKKSKGNFVTSITDIGGIMDVLSGMRGSNQLLRDLVRRPQKVKKALEKIRDAWFETFEYFSDKLMSQQNCMVAWNGIYSEKPTYTLQNDMSCMISPEMFREFSLGNIKEITKGIDRTVYHLDGPGALKHLDEILSLEDLNAIQWIPGAGAPGGANPDNPYGKDKGMLHWVGQLEEIKEKGKSIEVSVHPEDAVPLIKELGPENLLLKMSCRNQREGRRIYEKIREKSKNL